MAVTAPTDVTAWVPELISTSVYDTALDSDYTLTALAQTVPDVEGKPGETITLPTLGIVAPADNLAVTTAAVDDKLTGAGVDVVIKEAVKSVAFYDRTKWATGTDFNALAGRAVGKALNDRVELDLAAAAVAGRNVAADTFGGAAAPLTVAVLRAMRAKVPAGLRRRGGGLVAVGAADDLETLLADTAVANAANFGSDEAIREGDFSRPVAGVRLRAVDDGVLPAATVLFMVPGVLIRAVQKASSSEVERDARARLTRVVGTTLHAEGVIDSRGIVQWKRTVS